jgi:hypothetical protein
MATNEKSQTVYIVTVEFSNGTVRLITKTFDVLAMKAAVRRVKSSGMLNDGRIVVDTITMYTEAGVEVA